MKYLNIISTGFVRVTCLLFVLCFLTDQCKSVRRRAVVIQRYTGSDTSPWCSHTCAGSLRCAPGIHQYLHDNTHITFNTVRKKVRQTSILQTSQLISSAWLVKKNLTS